MAQHSAWFPDKLNIQPFTANFLEPKLGFAFHNGTDNVRLDISNSRDIYYDYELTISSGIDPHYFYENETVKFEKYFNKHFSVGADLFTYTRLRREDEFHFPVETIDYLFGLNAGYKVVAREILPTRISKMYVRGAGTNDSIDVIEPRQGKIFYEYGIRFRLSHISAHLVDGKYDNNIRNWRDGDIQRVYSREFIELFPYFKIHDLRVYAGLTYLIHVTPKGLGKDIYQIGFDYFAEDAISNLISPYIAYDFKLNHINKYTGNNILTAGIKFGNGRGSGCSLQYSYISGKSIHGEYFDKNESYSTLGFNIDL